MKAKEWQRIAVELVVISTLILVSVLALFQIIDVATRAQRHAAIQSATDVVGALVTTELGLVAGLTLDYAYWDDALRHLSVPLDREWAKANIGNALHSAQGIDLSAVVDRANVVQFLHLRGKDTSPKSGLDLRALDRLLAEARSAAPAIDAVPRSVVVLDGKFFFVAALGLIQQSVDEADAPQWRRDHPDQPVLVFARELDKRFMDRLTNVFHISEARLGADPCDKNAAGCISLGRPDLPVGHISVGVPSAAVFLSAVKPPVAVLVAAIIAACAIAVIRMLRQAKDLIARNAELDSEVARRKKSEAEVKDREELYRSVISTTHDAFWINDTSGRLLEVNENYVQRSGFSRDELLKMNVADLEVKESAADVVAHIEAVRIRGGHLFTTQHRTKSGEIWDAEVAISYSPVAGGRLFVFFRDITWRVRAEAEKVRLEGQLRYARQMEMVGRLSGGMAHYFNNLLQVINFGVEMARLQFGDDGKAAKGLDSAKDAVRQGARLNQRLLSFSRKTTLRPKIVDPNEVANSAVRLLQRTFGANIEIKAHLAEGLSTIAVDTEYLEDALLNVALNARSAMPEGGKLSVETSARRLDGDLVTPEGTIPAGDYVEISVADTGCGMAPEVRERAFEPFFTTREVGEGEGLGLSVVYGFVLQSEGHIAIESAPGEGTIVRLIFPAVTASARTPSTASE